MAGINRKWKQSELSLYHLSVYKLPGFQCEISFTTTFLHFYEKPKYEAKHEKLVGWNITEDSFYSEAPAWKHVKHFYQALKLKYFYQQT